MNYNRDVAGGGVIKVIVLLFRTKAKVLLMGKIN